MTLVREIRGEGPPLLLLHGLGSNRAVWRPVLPTLAETFTVIAVDLPGHGDSPSLPPGADSTPAGLAASVTAVLDELGLKQVDIAGNSLGGWIGLEMAKVRRARSITALAPAGFWDSDIRHAVIHVNRWASRALRPIAPALLKARPVRAMSFWSASADARAMDPQDAIDAVNAHAGARGWARALHGTQGRSCDARRVSRTIPVTIVWGDQDRILPASDCELRDGAPPHARWVKLDRCGHVPMWDQPAETVRLIQETVAAARPVRRSTTRQPTARG